MDRRSDRGPDTPAPSKDQCLLLIDDCEDVHDLVAGHLRHLSIVLKSAFDGPSGLRLAFDLLPDLVLLDVDLPGMDGYELCRQLVSSTPTMNIPVVFLTAASSVAEKIRGLELGALDFLVKPIDPAELQARVQTALRTKRLVDLLARRAEIDPVTGVRNRPYFEHRLETELVRAERLGASLSCIIADVDGFKGINDAHGRAWADEALRSVCRTIDETSQPDGVVCRSGGDDVVILMPDTDLAAAERLVERLRRRITELSLPRGGATASITCSFGIAAASAGADRSLFQRARRALAQAKSAGLNQIVVDRPGAARPRFGSHGHPVLAESDVQAASAATPILIVDDDDVALAVLERLLGKAGYPVHVARNGAEALACLRRGDVRLVVSDLKMPVMDGIELCKAVREEDLPGYVYIILLTGRDAPHERVAGLSAGADDFMAKPFDHQELLARVRAGERVLSLETREVAIFALARLAESRDPETGQHLERVRCYSRIIAQHLAADPGFQEEINGEYIRLIYLTSPLHDIGKVGIPDSVLLKTGRLSDREFDVMKRHTTIGAATLDAAVKLYPGVPFLQMGRAIALTHHERYDGSGYPTGLKGEDIPLAGRIVALADVYDALTSRRSYKDAFSHDVARSILIEERGRHFDPAVLDAFLANEDKFALVRERFSDANDAGPVWNVSSHHHVALT